jgi:large subunit ribosomal protein L21|uniref:Ribosomal protein L21 n=1 Tax=Synura petersenii TaxID=52555 RepID=A0A3G2QYI0_9STRA|nr:ribosomal protein L21 [Synura petersenii]AYO28170.1 ribosomal protein L21 [Synura petersenii]
MKYAIAQTSGKQFLLKPGQWYDVDYIKNVNLGDFISIKKILFFRKNNAIQLGEPFLEKSEIPAKIIQQVKGKKIIVLKTKPKKKYTRTRGHRQPYTRVQIDTKI